MKTTKRHVLDHLYDSKRLGDIRYMVADVYEESHEIFENNYEGTLKRPKTAMKDTLWIQEKTARP